MTTWAFEIWVLESERKKSEIWHETVPSPALKTEKPHGKECGQPLGAESDPSWQPARKLGAQLVLHSQGTGFCQQPEWDWKWIPPLRLWMRKQSSQHLGFSIVRSWADNQVMPCLDFCSTDCELINGCCCKLRNLCWYVMKRQKTNTQSIHFLTYKMKITTLSTS